MSDKNMYSEKLFSYGTLRYEAVQLSTFGRRLNGAPAIINGYQLSQLKINDPSVVAMSGEDVHPILIETKNINDQVNGVVFDVSLQEVEMADQYEVEEYQRVCMTLDSGVDAWVYVVRSRPEIFI